MNESRVFGFTYTAHWRITARAHDREAAEELAQGALEQGAKAEADQLVGKYR